MNPSNAMKILQFEDMRLEYEKGEVWGSIRNGSSAFGDEDGGQIYFLQSNYFAQTEKLYLRINKVQALSKEEAVAEINTETGEWLNQPEDQKIQLLTSNKSHVVLSMKNWDSETFPYDLFSSIIDAKGKEVEKSAIGTYSDEGSSKWNVSFRQSNYTNPLKLELFAYPNYLEGDVKVELK